MREENIKTEGMFLGNSQKTESLLIKENDTFSNDDLEMKKYFPENEKGYKVLTYASNCEEHNQIEFILPLRCTTCKLIIFIILNICTVGLINLLITWFPKLILYVYYSTTTLELSTHFGIFSKDKEFNVVEKKEIVFPNLSNYDSDSIVNKFNINIKYSEKSCIMFEFRLFNYIFSTLSENFEALDYYIKEKHNLIIEEYSTGINPNEISLMRSLFGVCDIDIKINSMWKILLGEITDPFYLFQLYSVILWYCTRYYYYATVIVVLTILSLSISVYETHKNLKKLQEISRYSCPVKVYRKNENNKYLDPIEINSTKLVPGDLIEIPNEGNALPCDTILIGGSVIVNEAMLTGESTPVIKVRMPNSDDIYDTKTPDSDKYLLFNGTKIIQKRKTGNSNALGIVYSTGFNTFKGNLINAIINPKEENDNFTKDSVKYIIFMGILCIVGFAISIKFLKDANATNEEILEKFLDLITTAVPPSLPACLSIGITYSLHRLKKKGIFCIKREGVNKAGSVNIIVFDKTGTLTEDHLDISGYVTVKMDNNKQFLFNNFTDDCKQYSDIVVEHFKKKEKEKNYKNKNNDLLQYYIECLACCHCLTYVNDKLVGDPIDVGMFENLDWVMKENENNSFDPLVINYVRPKTENDMKINIQNNKKNFLSQNSRYEIGVVKRFDFSSKLQRMTTICKNLNENYFKVFCKGSPEKIKELCNQKSIPQNFDEILDSYTTKGYRVLGMAAKSLIMDFQQSQTVTRDFIEKNMIFLGFLIVKNKLKEKTKESLIKYDAADIRMVMATGDNLLTAICVAQECNLIQKNQEMYSLEFDDSNKLNENLEIVKWEKISMNNNENNEYNEFNEYDDISIGNNITQECTNLNYSQSDFSFNDLFPPDEINNENLSDNDDELNKFNKTRKRSLSKNFLVNLQEDEELNEEDENNNLLNTSRISENKLDYSLYEIDEKELNINIGDNYGIAITGNTFEKLYKINEKYEKNNIYAYKNIHECFRKILKNGRVFARMAPEHKALLVESFKKEGLTTLMCGDGANDCSALRTAHVGVSLSPEEASIAANFTSKTQDVSCIFELLREGKCSLTTSVQTFKYMMLYSMIQFISVTLMMIYITYLSDFQFLVTDLFLIFPLEWFLAMTHPYEKLTYHYPISGLLSFPVLASIITQTLLVLAFQLGGYKILKYYYGWENICDFDENDDPTPCHENTILFLIAHFQYIIMAIAFSVSKPFRQQLYKNWILMLYLIIVLFYSIWITINCDGWSKNLFDLYDLEKKGEETEGEGEKGEDLIKGGENMKYYLLLIIGINCIVHITIEWGVMKLIRYCYEESLIKKYKKEIVEEKVNQRNPDFNNKEVSIYKYQRVYYYDRRKQMKKILNEDVDFTFPEINMVANYHNV